MISAIAFLLVTGCVFFLVLVVFGVLGRAMERYKERYVSQSQATLTDMFMFVDPSSLFVLNICLTLLMAGLGWAIAGILGLMLFSVFGFLMPSLMIRYMKHTRIVKFNTQLIEALQQMSNAMKAGLTFSQAIDVIAKESKPPLQQEFSLFVKESKLGVSVDDAFINMAKRVGSDDLELVATSTNIARALGGNMSEMFETISTTIRERFRLESKIDSMTSQGKMQAYVVCAMPPILGIALNIVRPDLMEPMFDHWFGPLIVVLVILMEMMGGYIIWQIVNIDV